VHRSGSNAPY